MSFICTSIVSLTFIKFENPKVRSDKIVEANKTKIKKNNKKTIAVIMQKLLVVFVA